MVGLGPGSPDDRTHRAEKAIAASSVIVGYTRYIKSVSDLVEGKELIATGMTKEKDRCLAAVQRASEGAVVALISSGDAGIYGMAGLAIEMAQSMGLNLPIEVVPGVTAASALAAQLGAPLMLDFAVISLSDLMVPWETIKRRLEAVASADLAVALYNPRSKKRVRQLEETVEIFLKHQPPQTLVGVGTSVSAPDEQIIITDLGHLLEQDIGMRSLVIIGNSASRKIDQWFVTARGYKI